MPAIEALRTPDARFEGLSGYAFPPCYVDDLPGYEGLRAHYLDLGPKDAAHTFLCLHGEPSWSYLYRKMIPVFLEAGGRVVAPDFLGFGRSDKPVRLEDYGFHFHRDFLLRLVERLDLRRVTLVVQDWGGLLGLTLPVDPGFRARLERLIVMNTTLAVGKPAGPGFDAWRRYARDTPDMPVGALFARSDPQITQAETAAYDAPFPDARYKAGVRAFPALVMTDPGMEGVEESLAAAAFWSGEWAGPSFMAIGEADPVLGPPVMEALRRTIRAARSRCASRAAATSCRSGASPSRAPRCRRSATCTSGPHSRLTDMRETGGAGERACRPSWMDGSRGGVWASMPRCCWPATSSLSPSGR